MKKHDWKAEQKTGSDRKRFFQIQQLIYWINAEGQQYGENRFINDLRFYYCGIPGYNTKGRNRVPVIVDIRNYYILWC